MKFLRAITTAGPSMARTIIRHRGLLISITRVELAKKYAGSMLGLAWVLLQPALLLSAYLFIYMVVFPYRDPNFSRLSFVLYVFCGLVPYLGFMEALTAGGLSIRQNIHLVKNVMLPIELVPVRSVLVGMTTQIVSMCIVLVLVAVAGLLTPHVLWLPLIFALQVIQLIGLTWILASLTVALPDITYFVNLFVFLLMFVSPIGFRPEMLEPRFRAVVYLNPVYYMIQPYRDSMLNGQAPSLEVAAIFTLLSLGIFAVGAAFFMAFKGVLVDYE